MNIVSTSLGGVRRSGSLRLLVGSVGFPSWRSSSPPVEQTEKRPSEKSRQRIIRFSIFSQAAAAASALVTAARRRRSRSSSGGRRGHRDGVARAVVRRIRIGGAAGHHDRIRERSRYGRRDGQGDCGRSRSSQGAQPADDACAAAAGGRLGGDHPDTPGQGIGEGHPLCGGGSRLASVKV